MVCKICGFTPRTQNKKSWAGSMALHAKMKHGELDYTQIFEESTVPNTDKKPAERQEKKPPAKKPNVAPKNHWRLLNPKNTMEKQAIDAGYTKVNAIPSVDPADWDIA